jgi:16S rRNA (cytosine967-C5)-methyltransferase
VFADEQFDGFFVHAAKHKITTSALMKVNKTKRLILPKSQSGWVQAVGLTVHYLTAPTRADSLLMPLRASMSAREYAVCQELFYGVLRNLSLLHKSVDYLCVRAPIIEVRAFLMVAGYELLSFRNDTEKRALITHHAVEKAKEVLPPKFHGFINAILRRMPEAIEAVPLKLEDTTARFSIQYSHPKWLVRRFMAAFGQENTEALLRWDQAVPPVYIRLEGDVQAPACLKPTQWNGYYEYDGSGWSVVEGLLQSCKAYAQDPSTRLCIELLAPKKGESVLDLCAAPGGKARQVLPLLEGEGTLVCVDLPGSRCEHLRQNLSVNHGDIKVSILEKDVFELGPDIYKERGLPSEYDAVLLDAPCSNTGVIRRRPDARWRLEEVDIAKAAELQSRLLDKAASFVKADGRLVYSTCSIDEEENTKLVEQFLLRHPEFSLGKRRLAYPWIDGHDGAGAFLLTRNR